MAKHKASKKRVAPLALKIAGVHVHTIVGLAIVVAGASLLAAAGAFLSIKRVCKYPDGSYGASCTADMQCRSFKPAMKGQCVYAPVSTRATQALSKPIVIPKLTAPKQIPKPIPLPIPPRPPTR